MSIYVDYQITNLEKKGRDKGLALAGSSQTTSTLIGYADPQIEL